MLALVLPDRNAMLLAEFVGGARLEAANGSAERRVPSEQVVTTVLEGSAFLAMSDRIQAFHWAATPLGSRKAWPRALRTAVDIALSSRQPMFIAWGQELTFLYNDAYAEILGSKHPDALGRPFHRVWWEIWDDVKPLIDRALGGEATWSENLPLTIERKGFREGTWWTFSYSPIRNDEELIAGMFCSCMETTAQVMAERQSMAERQRLFEMSRAISSGSRRSTAI